MDLGIMQGRLSMRPYPKLQEFPFLTWEREFGYASEIGFQHIEWIFEKNRYEENPIWTSEGRRKIERVIRNSGIKVTTLCADYFLDQPFFRTNENTVKESVDILKELIKKSSEIGVEIILMPVLEAAEIRNQEDKKILYEVLGNCSNTLEDNKVLLGLETELKAADYLELVVTFNHPRVGIYYDTGNCAAKGYDMKKDMEILKDHLVGIHIKDRKINGPSVYLGTGDTNLCQGIPYLLQHGYEGPFVFQSYYEDDFMSTARNNRLFFNNLLKGI